MLHTARNSNNPRISIDLTDTFVRVVWGEFSRLLSTNAFAEMFPESCPDGNGTIGTDTTHLLLRLQAEILNIPIEAEEIGNISNLVSLNTDVFSKLTWDIIEFSFKYVSAPAEGAHHNYYKHHHLNFDRAQGIQNFREFIDALLATHGMAFELNDQGQIVRFLTDDVATSLQQVTTLSAKDEQLGELLARSQRQFLSRHLDDNREAVKTLWDAFERLKTLTAATQKDKKKSAEALLHQMSAEDSVRSMLDTESKKLTDIGNTYNIRHSETYQKPVTEPKHIRYLYLRMLSFIDLAASSLVEASSSNEDFDIPF